MCWSLAVELLEVPLVPPVLLLTPGETLGITVDSVEEIEDFLRLRPRGKVRPLGVCGNQVHEFADWNTATVQVK